MPPGSRLMGFGDSSVDLEVRYFDIQDPTNGVTNVRSQVLLVMWEKFREHGIEIPFPSVTSEGLGDADEGHLRGLEDRDDAGEVGWPPELPQPPRARRRTISATEKSVTTRVMNTASPNASARMAAIACSSGRAGSRQPVSTALKRERPRARNG